MSGISCFSKPSKGEESSQESQTGSWMLFWGWGVLGVGCADHRNVEQYMLALTKGSLMHSMTFEMLGPMALLRACVTKCLSQVKATV